MKDTRMEEYEKALMRLDQEITSRLRKYARTIRTDGESKNLQTPKGIFGKLYNPIRSLWHRRHT